MIERICEHCRQTYRTWPSQKPRFCSNACAGLFKRRGREVACQKCGKLVWASPSQPRAYCSQSCAVSARNHRNAGQPRPWLLGEKNPMFGRGLLGEANPMFGRRGERAPRWKGGRKIRKDGYVLVRAPDGHPHPSDSSSGLPLILEHRLVVERVLGRYLLPSEVVHHIDGNPTNNDPTNLRLFGSQAEHVHIAHADQPTGRKRARAASS